ncbi:MAG: HD family phosphohydrolase [Bdellovibrionales bacterium CG10_big_fil_rev_8_21_14_0_10_45_34]|nr:MAG: HD family phosphohydrolase [Bdellovibrionales bacterium CG10_big_fil_rev_8_21_14_0_10_45_34]
MTKQFVKDLAERTPVNSTFLCREKSVLTGKTGKPYISMTLSDRTGQIDGRIWDNAEEMAEMFEVDDFVNVKGNIQKFQGRKQIVVSAMDIIDTSLVDISEFLPKTKFEIDEMFSDLMNIVENTKDIFIKKLLQNTLTDNEIQPLFKNCPAAKTIHHAYIGGLLEHCLSICRIMEFLAVHYGNLNRDLLVFGAIYHDIGKIWELKFGTSIGYSDVGKLVGHIPLGSELVERKAREIENFPVDLKNILKHIVLSHHGKLEYGSPKVPSLLEAVVVGYIDDLDSKVNSISEFLASESESDSAWTRMHYSMGRTFLKSSGC